MLKCLVLDLDNTIWGGVVGEDGADGLRLTPDYLAVQQAALDLRERGILLTVCSRNNERDAVPALNRDGMLLNLEHFACCRINWREKFISIREIAVQLNIGLDAIAFVDDSPLERGFVRAVLPEVTVIELPDDPAGYAAAILAVFPEGSTTEEDKQRSGYYAEAKRRMEAEQQASSREEFLYSLGLELEVGRANRYAIPRIAQLSQRTNQFTLTGRKYELYEIENLLLRDDYGAYWGRLRDRFGDYGIIAAAIVQRVGAQRHLRDFYLSCRAMGRGVEKAFLDAIARDDPSPLICRAEPTERNIPAVEFFDDPLPVACPDWIHRILLLPKPALPILIRVLSIAADIFGRPVDAMASPETVEQWDSLGALNLMLALEDEYKIVFTAEEMEIAPNLGQLAAMVQVKLEAK